MSRDKKRRHREQITCWKTRTKKDEPLRKLRILKVIVILKCDFGRQKSINIIFGKKPKKVEKRRFWGCLKLILFRREKSIKSRFWRPKSR